MGIFELKLPIKTMEIVILWMEHIAPKIVMIPSLTSITAILILGIPLLILVMLLPAILQLKKTKEEDPRVTIDKINEIQILRLTRIVNIESEQEFDSGITQPLTKIIAVLPNLEV